MTSATIVEACDSRQLFGFDLFPLQRGLLAELDRAEARVHVWSLGRRSGKTTMAALVCLHDCLLRPACDAYVRPGERRYAVAVATNVRQARLLVSAARSVVERSPLLAGLLEAATEDELRFRTSDGRLTALAAFPCNSRGGRGWPISTVVFDEQAHMLDDTEGQAVAHRVWTALVPSTAQFGDLGRVICASTPYGTDGLFAELFAKADSGETPDATCRQLSTAQVNPSISADFLALEQARDPDGFRSEYGAEFVGSGAAYLDPERLDAAVQPRGEMRPDEGTDWTAGLDPSFSSDPLGLAIIGKARGGPDRLVLALARAWKPERQSTFEGRRAQEDVLLAEVARVCRAWKVRKVSTDQYMSAAVVNTLQRAGLVVEAVPMSSTSKTAAYAEMRSLLYMGKLELYDQPDLLKELRRLRTRFTAGAANVISPRVGGSHGDMAQAVAIACLARSQTGQVGACATIDPGIQRVGYNPSPFDRAGFGR